jgi:GTP-binding protein
LFLDEAVIDVVGGKGGNGAVAFRRDKYVPRGGPNGGTGGDGGSVILYVDPGLNTLEPFHYRQRLEGGRGAHGGGSNMQGARGADVRVAVPAGTVVRDAHTGDVLADLTAAGQEVTVARGGKGGRGNAAFKSPTNQTPRFAEKGVPGEEKRLELELKLLADVGIIGVPNAGKSTLLAALSAARPKVAPYPFTTLSPHLGVAEDGDERIVFADIPGLIEGASEGLGLGDRFLRHVERTRLLVHVLDTSAPDPIEDWRTVNRELEAFSPALAKRRQIVVLNKVDVAEAATRSAQLARDLRALGERDVIKMSALTGDGVGKLIELVARRLEEVGAEQPESAPLPVLRPVAEDPNRFSVYRIAGEDVFRVIGRRVEEAAAMTDFHNPEAVARFQRILDAIGVTERLRGLGVQDGATIRIHEQEFEWRD